MPNGFRSIQNLKLDLARTLADIQVEPVTISPEMMTSLVKFSEHQRELQRQLVANSDIQRLIGSVVRQQAELAATLQDINFTGIDTSAVEDLATSEFVLESAEDAEEELVNEVSYDDGEISDEEAQKILEWSGLIAAIASLREDAPSIGEDETTILTIAIFFIILSSFGFPVTQSIPVSGVLGKVMVSALSAAGRFEDENE